MKQKTITTDKATLLVVEMPEGAYYPSICQLPLSIGVNYFLYENGVNTPYKESLDIPKGNWQLLGRLPDITEKQAKLIVPEYHIERLYATESVYDLLKDSEVYFENPLGKERPKLKLEESDYDEFGFVVGDGMKKGAVWEETYWNWLEAQSKVFDKERCYLFIKVD